MEAKSPALDKDVVRGRGIACGDKGDAGFRYDEAKYLGRVHHELCWW